MSPIREKEVRTDSNSKGRMSEDIQQRAGSIRMPSLKFTTQSLNCIATILNFKVTSLKIFRLMQ